MFGYFISTKLFIMTNKIFIFLILISPIICFSQITIVDKINKTPLPYTTVKVLNKNIGNYANDKGMCILPDITNGDTIFVGYTGYEDAKFIFRKAFDTIYLVPKYINLQDVIVKQMNNTQHIGILKFTKNYSVIFSVTKEYAVKIDVPNNINTYKIQSIYLPIGFLSSNVDTNDVVVKLHVYDVNSNGEPNEDVLSTPIFITPKNIRNNELNEFNVSNQNIILHSSTLFVGVETVVKNKKMQEKYFEMIKNPTQANMKDVVQSSPVKLYCNGGKMFFNKEYNYYFVRSLLDKTYQWHSPKNKDFMPRFSAGISITY